MQFDIVRAWKDETYRQNLSQEQRDALPANPAGELELTDTDLEAICGGQCCTHSGHKSFHKSGDHATSMDLLICKVNIYSISIPIIPILSTIVQTCQKG